MTKVLIADDHPIVLSGVEAILRDSEFTVVGRASDGNEALEAIAKVRPDILLIDVSMPNLSGMDVLRTLRARGDTRKIVILTASLADSSLLEAITLKVDGIVLKEGAEHILVRCLETVRDGKQWIDRDALERALNYSLEDGAGQSDSLDSLTKRERAVAGLVAQGLRNRAIASNLGVTEGTIKVYLHRIYEKIGIGSRTELALLAREIRKIE